MDEERREQFLTLANQLTTNPTEGKDLEKQMDEAIALCKRRIQASVDLYGDGRISREEYLRRVERNEREITSWQARTTEVEKLGMELTMCLHAVETLTRMWEVSGEEDKQGMARHLFEYVTYDLEREEIVDFRLKPWAENFLRLRAALYTEQKNYATDYNENPIVPTGLEPVSSP